MNEHTTKTREASENIELKYRLSPVYRNDLVRMGLYSEDIRKVLIFIHKIGHCHKKI